MMFHLYGAVVFLSGLEHAVVFEYRCLLHFLYSIFIDNECDLRLHKQRSELIEDWAIEIDLHAPFALSTGFSSLSFQVDGRRVNSQADILLSDFVYCISLNVLPTSRSLCLGIVWVLETETSTFPSPWILMAWSIIWVPPLLSEC